MLSATKARIRTKNRCGAAIIAASAIGSGAALVAMANPLSLPIMLACGVTVFASVMVTLAAFVIGDNA